MQTMNGTLAPQDIDSVGQAMIEFIELQGQATKDEIRTHLKALGQAVGVEIPTELYQKSFVRLERQLNLVTEVSMENGKKAWTVQEWAKGLSLAQVVQMQMAVHAPSKPRENYTDWFQVSGVFDMEGHVLASNPNPKDQSERVFLRHGGGIILASGYYDAMLKAAARKAYAPCIGSAVYRVQWKQQTVPVDLIETILRPVPPARPGGSGQGVISCETLPPGTPVPFEATVPGSHVTAAEFDVLLQIAGEHVGFSPAASHKGWGRFRPVISE